MILQTGQRTDIPAFYSKWFMKRIHEGFVYVRNPYYPNMIYQYDINPQVVDVLGFCTKNPHPMLPYLEELRIFHQFWFVTLTPYGKDIEPNVPNKYQVIEDIKTLSKSIGKDCVVWRYDPILINAKYTIEYHLRAFEKIAKELYGYTNTVVISFIDLYTKVTKNFPEAKEVDLTQQKYLGKELIRIAQKYEMVLKTCAEGNILKEFGADCSGCMTQKTLEEAFSIPMKIPASRTTGRKECSCLITGDVGEYNTCLHFCRYCYANYSKEQVIKNYQNHNPDSPLLIGEVGEKDEIRKANQESWLVRNEEIKLF